MAEVYVWQGAGGLWKNPSNWQVAEVADVTHPSIVPGSSHIAARPPGPDDVVVVSPYLTGDGHTPGPLTGGGEAKELWASADGAPATLADDGFGAPDVYSFKEVHVGDRVLATDGAYLSADLVEVDATSTLDLSEGGTLPDAADRPVVADIGRLVLDPGPPAEVRQLPSGDLTARNAHGYYGGTVDLGSHDVVLNAFQNGNGWDGPTAGVFGTGHLLAVAPPDPVPSTPRLPTPDPEPARIDWDALAAKVQANFAATGQWFYDDPTTTGPHPGPSVPEGTTDWDAVAANVLANFAATGHWFVG